MSRENKITLFAWLAIFLTIWGISHIKVKGGIGGQCVELPNGIYLGYEAKFSFGNWLWKPFIVPKFPNGTPLLAGEFWPFEVTNNSIRGIFEGRNRDKEQAFFWTEETGVVFLHEDPKRFRQIEPPDEPLIDGVISGGFSALWYYERLSQHPAYDLIDCKTRLFRW